MDDPFLTPPVDCLDHVDVGPIDALLGEALLDEQTAHRLAALGLLADDFAAVRVVTAVILEAQGVEPTIGGLFDDLPPDLTTVADAHTPAAIAHAARDLARGGR